MHWTNYHSHTNYCDGLNETQDYISNAIKMGLLAYGYSSHAPIGFDTDWCIREGKLQEYLDSIKELKTKFSKTIQTYIGLEIDFIPNVAGWNKLAETYKQQLDYFIGSIHYVDSFADGTFWNIDHNKELFEKGLKEIFRSDFCQASKRFYELTRQMVISDKPDVVGHLDKIKMYNNNNEYFNENEDWYKQQIEETLETIKKSGVIVEVNTRGYYKYNQPNLYPSQWIIKRLAALNIPVMLNSDAHECSELIAGYEYAVEQLKKAGVKKLWALLDNKWQAFDYSVEGLKL